MACTLHQVVFLQCAIGVLVEVFERVGLETNVSPFLLGGRLGGVLSLAIHISPNNGPINMILSAKPPYYVLPIHFECSFMSIRPLVAKLQQVYGLCGR